MSTTSSVHVFVLLVLATLVSQAVPLQFVVSSHDELQWALSAVKPGDEIILPNVEISGESEPFRSHVDGTADNPVTIRGMGPTNSVLTRVKNGTNVYNHFELEHSHWIFDNFRFSGQFDAGLLISPYVQGVELRNMVFEQVQVFHDFSFGVIIANYGNSLLIDNCTFLVDIMGLYCHVMDTARKSPQVVDVNIRVTNSHFRPLSDATAVYFVGPNFVLENNTFSSPDESYYWIAFASVQEGRGLFKNNTGHRALYGGFNVHGFPGHSQEFVFDSNHCDVQSDSWCIDITPAYFNTTTIYDNNTFQNGKGLTNKPGHYY